MPQKYNPLLPLGLDDSGETPVPVSEGGTGESSAQNAINTLTDVASATDEHVLTKDTATGNAIFKAAAGGWSKSGANISPSTTTDEVIIGASSPISSAKLSVDGDADQIQVVIQGNSTQTSDIFVVEKSDGTDLFKVTNTAGITVGGSSSIITPSSGNLGITDASDATKIVAIQASGATTGKTLTLISAHTDNRSITFPNVTDTLVGKDTTDTLTNKTLTSPTLTTPALGTPASGTLTNCTGLPQAGTVGLTTADSPQLTGINVGHASDTTVTRSAAGILAVEGVVIPSISSTNTLTNKRITKRSVSTDAPGATPTINTDTTDVAHFTGLAAAITSMTTNLSGTPVEGDSLRIDFTDNATARAITWGASFEASGGVALPTTTVLSVRLDVGFVWNTVTSKWRCVAVA